jgi:hypothetical protein
VTVTDDAGAETLLAYRDPETDEPLNEEISMEAVLSEIEAEEARGQTDDGGPDRSPSAARRRRQHG